MADEQDPRLKSAYRALGAEEPPRALDEAILAASRRAVEAHPAPLVAPTGRRAWFVPLAAAAVLVLAVSLTLHLQFEQSGEEKGPAPAERAREVAPEQFKPAASPPPEREQQAPRLAQTEAPARAAAKAGASKSEQRREPVPFAADSAAQARKSLEALERQVELERRVAPRAEPVAGSAPAAAAPVPAAAVPAAPAAAVAKPALERSSAEAMAKRVDAAAETPEKELERIARLRGEGRHEEADKALAEFRKRFPDYKISEEMRTKVERRP